MDTLYRITYNNKGIYNELKRIVGPKIWLELLSLKEFNWLPKPPTYSAQNKSYFTKKGYEIFKQKTLPIVYKYLDKRNIKVETFDKVENVMYADEYQIIETK